MWIRVVANVTELTLPLAPCGARIAPALGLVTYETTATYGVFNRFDNVGRPR
jgi:hypothetical protein